MATVVHVFAGEYDLTHKARLRADFERLQAQPHLIFDLSAVTYLDSIFISELMWIAEKRAERGWEPLMIVRPSPIVKKVFALLYVFAFARVVGTLEQALPNDGRRVVLQHACAGDNLAPPNRVGEFKMHAPTPAWISAVLTAAGI